MCCTLSTQPLGRWDERKTRNSFAFFGRSFPSRFLHEGAKERRWPMRDSFSLLSVPHRSPWLLHRHVLHVVMNDAGWCTGWWMQVAAWFFSSAAALEERLLPMNCEPRTCLSNRALQATRWHAIEPVVLGSCFSSMLRVRSLGD